MITDNCLKRHGCDPFPVVAVLTAILIVVPLMLTSACSNHLKTYSVTGLVYEWLNPSSSYSMIFNFGDNTISSKELIPLSDVTINFTAFGPTGNPISLFSIQSLSDGTFHSGLVTAREPGMVTVSKNGYNTASQTGLDFIGNQLVVIMVKND